MFLLIHHPSASFTSSAETCRTHKDSFQPNRTPVSAHAVIHRWRQGLTKHENAANLTEAEDCSGLGILGFHATTGVKK